MISEDEKNYDRNTGDLYNFKSTKGTGMELNSFEFDYSNVASMEMKFGSSLESNTYAGMQISNSNYLGAKLDVIFEAAGSIELKGSVGPSIEISNGKVDIELPGFEYHFKSPVTVETDITTFTTKMTEIKQSANVLKSGMCTLSNHIVTLFN